MSDPAGARTPARRARHLVVRFATSLDRRGPTAADEAWARAQLEPAETAWFARLDAVDRRHAIRVARSVEARLAATPEAGERRWLAAALCHDVGKLDAGLGTLARVAATAVAGAAGHGRARAWAASPAGVRAHVGRYVDHDRRGEAALRAAGARPEVAAWAGAHHTPGSWAGLGFPPEVVAALVVADGELA